MSRKLASVVRIATCDPIPDTDKLSVATMEGKGWKVVTGRDEYKAGDLAVYLRSTAIFPLMTTGTRSLRSVAFASSCRSQARCSSRV